MNSIPSAKKVLNLVDTEHSYFFWNSDPTWTMQLSSEIEACVTDDCKKEDRAWGWIYGGAIGGLVLLMILIVCCCCRKKD